MRTRLLVFVVVWIGSGLVDVPEALWIRMTEAALLAGSDVIVLAELIGHTRIQRAADAAPRWLGVLRVEQVVKGDPGLTTLLLVVPVQAQVSTDIVYHRGQRGLWFLHLYAPDEIGFYAANHPQRFLAEPQASERLEALRGTLQQPPLKR